MVLILYGIAFSTCTCRAATVVHEKKVPFELVQIDLSKKAPSFLTNQPFGDYAGEGRERHHDKQGPECHQVRALLHSLGHLLTRYRWFNELSERPSWVAVKDGVKSASSY
ncbi:hypothetical protein FB451DRAFT_1175339 [Mycena latifolia]|nr:hypothetical protein FB451DRAFT_1175339 [Mycena latifolia]